MPVHSSADGEPLLSRARLRRAAGPPSRRSSDSRACACRRRRARTGTARRSTPTMRTRRACATAAPRSASCCRGRATTARPGSSRSRRAAARRSSRTPTRRCTRRCRAAPSPTSSSTRSCRSRRWPLDPRHNVSASGPTSAIAHDPTDQPGNSTASIDPFFGIDTEDDPRLRDGRRHALHVPGLRRRAVRAPEGRLDALRVPASATSSRCESLVERPGRCARGRAVGRASAPSRTAPPCCRRLAARPGRRRIALGGRVRATTRTTRSSARRDPRRHPSSRRHDRATRRVLSDRSSASHRRRAEPPFDVLLEHLKRTRGFDFTGYKRASLERRIAQAHGGGRRRGLRRVPRLPRGPPGRVRAPVQHDPHQRHRLLPRRRRPGTTCAPRSCPRLLDGAGRRRADPRLVRGLRVGRGGLHARDGARRGARRGRPSASA